MAQEDFHVGIMCSIGWSSKPCGQKDPIVFKRQYGQFLAQRILVFL